MTATHYDHGFPESRGLSGRGLGFKAAWAPKPLTYLAAIRRAEYMLQHSMLALASYDAL